MIIEANTRRRRAPRRQDMSHGHAEGLTGMTHDDDA